MSVKQVATVSSGSKPFAYGTLVVIGGLRVKVPVYTSLHSSYCAYPIFIFNNPRLAFLKLKQNWGHFFVKTLELCKRELCLRRHKINLSINLITLSKTTSVDFLSVFNYRNAIFFFNLLWIIMFGVQKHTQCTWIWSGWDARKQTCPLNQVPLQKIYNSLHAG